MYTFSGKVTDAQTHEGLFMASVALLGPSGIITGVNTNQDGTFTFTVQNADAVTGLKFSYVGYEPQTLTKSATPYMVSLIPVGVTGPGAVITASKYPTLKAGLLILAAIITIHLISKYY